MRTSKTSETRISAKLLASFAAVLALVLGLTFSSLVAIGKLGASLDTAVKVNSRKLRLIGEIHTGFEEMRADSTKVEMSLVNMLVGHLGGKGAGAESECSGCHTRENVNAQKQRFDEVGSHLKSSIAALRPLAGAGSERSALDTMDGTISEWLRLYENYLSLAWQQDFSEAHEIMVGKIYPLVDSLGQLADQLVSREQQLLGAASEEADARVAGSRTVALTLLGLCLAVGCGVYWIVRGVNFVLREFAGELKRSTERVAAAASQVSSSSRSLAEGASEQAASLEETSASSKAIEAMARKSAGSCEVAAEKMEEAVQRVNDANRYLQEMVDSMAAIGASSEKISRIIKVIDEIAFQTNILALNAAVEAARAGEAGLSFGVVADEVRNLAQRCSQAARDTAGLVADSIAISQDGAGTFNKVIHAIRYLTESASHVKIVVDGIKSDSREQTRGVEHIAQAIGQVEKVTQANADSAHQNAAAGEELKGESAALESVVRRLAALV